MWQQHKNGIKNKVLGQNSLNPGKYRLKMAQISADDVMFSPNCGRLCTDTVNSRITSSSLGVIASSGKQGGVSEMTIVMC